MNRLLWIVILLSGVGLLGCNPAQPVETTRIAAEETTIPQNTMAAENTAVPLTLPPTLIPATQTPIPTPTPIATNTATVVPATPENTPIPLPTPTEVVLPSPTPALVLLVPIEPVAPGQSLPINHDLLFVQEGQLKVWQPQSGQIRTIWSAEMYASVTSWRLLDDKQTIFFVTEAADDMPGFTFSTFHIESQEINELLSVPDSYYYTYALAPNGSIGLITSIPTGEEDMTIYTVRVFNRENGQISTLADCPNRRELPTSTGGVVVTRNCGGMVAAPDGRSWLWSDIEGIWQGGEGQTPRMLVAHEYYENDFPRIFSPTSIWSPNGRYQLLVGARYKGYYIYVLDVSTGSLVETPQYGTELSGTDPQWLWLADGRLAVLHYPYGLEGRENALDVWRFEDSVMVMDLALRLPYTDWFLASDFSQLEDGRLAYVYNHANPAEAETRSIYFMDALEQPPEAWVSLPPLENDRDGQSLFWLPDAEGVIYQVWFLSDEHRSTYYIPPDGSVIYDITEIIGDDTYRLLWLS